MGVLTTAWVIQIVIIEWMIRWLMIL